MSTSKFSCKEYSINIKELNPDCIKIIIRLKTDNAIVKFNCPLERRNYYYNKHLIKSSDKLFGNKIEFNTKFGKVLNVMLSHHKDFVFLGFLIECKQYLYEVFNVKGEHVLTEIEEKK